MRLTLAVAAACLAAPATVPADPVTFLAAPPSGTTQPLAIALPAAGLPPEPVTFSAEPPGDTNQLTATFVFSGGTPPYACSIDGGALSKCTSPVYESGLPEGLHTFSVEDACNSNSVCTPAATYPWTTDYTPPSVMLTGQPPTLTNQTTAVFSFSSNDPTATFRCSLNGAAYAPCTSPVTYTGLSAGTRQFNVEAVDLAGNVSLGTGAATWTVDLTPPQTTISGGPAQGSVSSTATATFALSSTKTGSAFQCSLDGAAFAPCPATESLSGLGDGAHTFAARAVDGAGNVDPNPPHVSWTVDTSTPAPPVVSLSAEPVIKPVFRGPITPNKEAHRRKVVHRGRSAHAARASRPTDVPVAIPNASKSQIFEPTILPPVKAGVPQLGALTLSRSAVLSWTSSDPNIAYYSVQGTNLPELRANNAGSIDLPLPEGPDCYKVTAVGVNGLHSEESLPACTTVPIGWSTIRERKLDVGELVTAKGFPRCACADARDVVLGTSYFDGEATNLSEEPLPLVVGGAGRCNQSNNPNEEAFIYCFGAEPAKGTDLGLLVTECPTCGSVEIQLYSAWDTVENFGFNVPESPPLYSHTFKLASSTVTHQRLVQVTLPNNVVDEEPGVMDLQPVSGSPRVEAIAYAEGL